MAIEPIPPEIAKLRNKPKLLDAGYADHKFLDPDVQEAIRDIRAN